MSQECLRPRPQVSGYFWMRNFFFPDTASIHTYPVTCTTGALWAKRGERGILHEARDEGRRKIKLFFSPGLAPRAKCCVHLAWLIKRLLCRLRIRWIRHMNLQLFESALQSENFLIRSESRVVWTLSPDIFLLTLFQILICNKRLVLFPFFF